MQVAGIDNELFGGLVVSVSAVIKDAAISHEKRHAHKYAVKPKLVLAACAGGMPEATIGRSG